MGRNRRRAALMAAAVLAGAAPAAAGPVDELTVTASRRAKALAAVPSNTALLDAADIALIRADHVSEALNRLPGLNIQRGNGQEHLTAIRSPVLTGGAGAGSFLYLEDGVPLRAAGFANVNGLFDAHSELAGSIEAVRGPGSALYGSNAVHGLINVLTPAPTETLSVFADASWGSFDRGRFRGSVSGTADGVGVWGGVTLMHEGGYRDDAGLDQQKATLRLDHDGGATRVTAILAANNLNQETAGFLIGTDAYDDSARARTNPNPEAFRDARSVRAQVRVDFDVAADTTVAVTPYVRWNEMDFLMHFLPSKALEKNGHKSVGILSGVYRTFADGSELVIGADGEVTDGSLSEVQSLPSFGSFPQGVHYNFDVVSLAGALYGHGEWQATDRLRVIGGIRWELTRYDYDNNAPSDTVGRFFRPADRSDTFSVVTPKLGAVFALNADNVLFANLARGARAPQIFDLYRLQAAQTVGDVREEKIHSVELGARGTVRGVRYEVAAFAMQKKNFFFRDADGLNVIDGRTNHWGVEASGTVPLHDRLDLSFAATYARHTYDFTRTTGNANESIVNGDDVDTAPRVIANVRLTWRPLPGVTGEIEWQHMGRYYTDAANDNDYPGHDLINLRATWDVTDAVQLYATVRNATNTDYAERADFAFGSERYFPGESRAFSGGIALRF